MGGSIIGELSSFNNFWVSKKEWNEEKNLQAHDPMKIKISPEAETGQKHKNASGLALINKKCA